MDSSRVILLVEDNKDDEDLTLRALKKAGITNTVLVARDGAEAVEMLHGEKAIEPPHVILLDLSMPKLSGLDVLRRIRADERTKLVPVVVFTSSKQEEDILSSYVLGANAYVRKPVEFQQFTEAVKILGLFWLIPNEPVPRRAMS